jgi:hypothetical protein
MDPTHFILDGFAFPTTDVSPRFGVDGFQWVRVTVQPGGFVSATVAIVPRVSATVSLAPRRAARVTLSGGAA